MKSFIVAAMLVATVAGQSFDMFKYGQDKSMLLNKQYGQNELLLKKLGYPMMDKSMMYPTTTYQNKDLVDLPFYLKDDLMHKQILSIDELYTTQLFKEYLSLPLFREYIQYPIFQKFVESIYFQKFWTVPEFKQYFINPVYFYKYILPIVHLFKYDNTFVTPFEQQIVNKNVLPFVSGYEHDFQVPTVYNKDYLLQDGLFYKNLLDKVYSHLYNIDETTTVKKIVDPITGEIKMIPVEGIYNKQFGFDTLFGDKLVKDVLLKKFLVNKNVDIDTIFGDKLVVDLLLKKNVDIDLLKKIILSKQNVDFDTTIFGDKLIKDLLLKKNVDVELLKDLLVKKDVDIELIKKLVLNKMIVGEDMTHMLPEEFYLKEKMNKMMMNPVYSRFMYGKQMIPEIYNVDKVEKMNLFDILAKKDFVNKFETIDSVDKMNLFDILSKKDLVIKDKILLNKILADKINEIENFETVMPKMYNDITKFERVPLTLEGVKPMMGVRTFDKKIFPEIIKA